MRTTMVTTMVTTMAMTKKTNIAIAAEDLGTLHMADIRSSRTLSLFLFFFSSSPDFFFCLCAH